MSQRVRRRSGVLAATVATALAGTLVLGGCSGGDDDPAGEPDSAPSATTGAEEEPAVVTQVSFGEVTGRLGRPHRARLSEDVRSVVDGWLEAAYLGGDYPRTDFKDAWPGFTSGAQSEAKRDAELMSNRDIGGDIDGVEPVGSAVRIDVLAVKKKPVGVTAHVILKFDTSGDKAERVKVAGRLYLTKADRGWRVFGYDVTKEAI
ncbi:MULTISPECIES: hypothetical protein [unclassified Nocardioides]|uniref:hypothetical protein n=1 Tax=unclassified Nocardioides TaxID=2615069 RepID=UPI00362343D9